MASNDAKEALLYGLLDPTKQKKNMLDPKVRRIRRIKSAPLAEFVPPDINGKDSSPPTKPVFGELHQSFIKVALFLAIYLGIGSMCFYFARNHIDGKKTNGLLDAVYFCIVTMTTVGYGDLVPHSTFSKLLACLFVFTGMALIGLILSKAADYLVEKQEVLLVKALHMQHRLGLSEILKEIETNRVRYKCYLATGILFVVMLVGTTFLHKVEHLDLIDAFYCVCATITTLGYGDVSFSTTGGRIFAVVWILIGTISLAQMFLCVAELFTESRQRALVNWVLTRKMTNTDLEAADFDNDGVVGAAEFVLYKLKEMGKITQEDIALIMEEFEELDVDQSGSISLSDISIDQSTETKR